jgi:hypothetical protein
LRHVTELRAHQRFHSPETDAALPAAAGLDALPQDDPVEVQDSHIRTETKRAQHNGHHQDHRYGDLPLFADEFCLQDLMSPLLEALMGRTSYIGSTKCAPKSTAKSQN